MSKRNRIQSILDDSDEEETVQRDKRFGKSSENLDESFNELTKENNGDDNESTSEHDCEATDLPANFRVNTSKPTRSSHPIWEMFGQLEKGGKTIAKTKDRIFCTHCFGKNKMKR